MEGVHKPSVSIIIPSYNQGRFIRETIESCLAQDYRPLEVIIVDGASTDNTVDVLHQYNGVSEITWISEPDSGVAEAVNKGFNIAKGEIAGIQSSDDTYTPGAVSQAVRYFIRVPELAIVYADCMNVDPTGRELNSFRSAPFTLEGFLSKETLILQPAAFFRLDLAKELGGWNAEYFVCDTELWLRMVFRAPARKVDAIWGRRVMHDAQRNTQTLRIVESHNHMIVNSPDIAHAPRRLRHAAQCGNHLTAAVYNPGGKSWKRTYYYWRAFLAFPSVHTLSRFKQHLIPGYWNLWRVYSHLRKGIAKTVRSILRAFSMAH
jgi:glycosyltransferase involved in cell wall biosynthesis